MREYLMTFKYSLNRNPTFENFEAECPECKHYNIFNRATDLKTLSPIGFATVACEKCHKKFNINGDRISPKYHYIVMDCYKYLNEKRYTTCILNLCTAYEAFFYSYLYSFFLIKPFFVDSVINSINRFNEINQILNNEIKDFSFVQMRNIFIHLILRNNSLKIDSDIIKVINNLPCLKQEVPDKRIKELEDEFLKEYLLRLKNHDINIIRNSIAHKTAYRPPLKEVESHLTKCRDIIFSLAAKLELKKYHKYLYNL
jgi:hypothetical protein